MSMFKPKKAIFSHKVREGNPGGTRKRFELDSFLFKEQLAFVRDNARFATACCSVRSGKTVSCAADLTATALAHPGSIGLYITLARSSAKRIVWPELLKINRDYRLKGKVNIIELSLTFPNKAKIYCGGASTESEIEKYRGLSNVILAYVDECQAFRAHIRELVNEVLVKRLYDTGGRLRLIGTPGPMPVGFFYEACQSDAWSHHAWTLHSNPWLLKKSGKTAEEHIAEDCRLQGIDINHPSIRRECFGEWAKDETSLLLVYREATNSYSSLPDGKLNYIMGVDLGFVDSDSISILAWSDASNVTYLVEEVIVAGQITSQLAATIQALMLKYPLSKMVGDAGGLGKKSMEDLKQTYGIPIEPADKMHKLANYAMLNNALRNGTFKAKASSMFAQDCNLLEKDRDKTTPEKVIVKGHSDAVDSVLYAFRFSPAYTYTAPKPKPAAGTPEAARELETMIMEHNLAKIREAAEQEKGAAQRNWKLDENGIPSWNKWE